jgi:hypothetical protein
MSLIVWANSILCYIFNGSSSEEMRSRHSSSLPDLSNSASVVKLKDGCIGNSYDKSI